MLLTFILKIVGASLLLLPSSRLIEPLNNVCRGNQSLNDAIEITCFLSYFYPFIKNLIQSEKLWSGHTSSWQKEESKKRTFFKKLCVPFRSSLCAGVAVIFAAGYQVIKAEGGDIEDSTLLSGHGKYIMGYCLQYMAYSGCKILYKTWQEDVVKRPSRKWFFPEIDESVLEKTDNQELIAFNKKLFYELKTEALRNARWYNLKKTIFPWTKPFLSDYQVYDFGQINCALSDRELPIEIASDIFKTIGCAEAFQQVQDNDKENIIFTTRACFLEMSKYIKCHRNADHGFFRIKNQVCYLPAFAALLHEKKQPIDEFLKKNPVSEYQQGVA